MMKNENNDEQNSVLISGLHEISFIYIYICIFSTCMNITSYVR